MYFTHVHVSVQSSSPTVSMFYSFTFRIKVKQTDWPRDWQNEPLIHSILIYSINSRHHANDEHWWNEVYAQVYDEEFSMLWEMFHVILKLDLGVFWKKCTLKLCAICNQ